MSHAIYVLVPGAGGDAFYWHLVAPRLRALGHEVITPDLPAGDDTAGLAAYADAIVAAVGDRSGVVLVAQSMAAFSAPLACDRVDAARIVLVAPMIPAPDDTPGTWWETSGQSAARREQELREGRDPDAPFDARSTFLHDVGTDTLAEVLARGEPRQSHRPFADTWPLAAWPDVPTTVIAGRRDRLFPLEFQRRMARERLGVEHVGVIDAGHLPAFSRPAELTGRLQAHRPGR